jgi:hypothetical protein
VIRYIPQPLAVCIILALAPVLLTACAGAKVEPTPLTAPIPATIETVAQHAGERVVIEGYLVAHSSIVCDDSRCSLWLTATPVGRDGSTYQVPELFAVVRIYEMWHGHRYPNTLVDIPIQWEPEDILVMGNNREDIHLNDRIRVIGWVEVTDSGRAVITGPNPCDDVPGGPDRLAAFESYQCPETGFTIELLEE